MGMKECLRRISRKTRRRSVSLTSISAPSASSVAGLLGDYDKMIILLVFGERGSEAIENSPAHRRYQPQADAVLVCENRITLRVHNLQLVHPPANGSQKQCLTSGEDRRAPGKQLLAKRIPPHRAQSAPISAR